MEEARSRHTPEAMRDTAMPAAAAASAMAHDASTP
jgi:hypothetical protein